jgi:nucleolar pre-ribosomal-associated protein 1
VGKLTRAARSIEHHLEEYTRITGISVAPLLASESLAKLSRAGGVGAVDVDALNPDTLKRYLSSILLRPTLRSAQIGALILSCSSAALRCLEGILAGQPSPPNQSSPTTKVLLPLFRAYLQQKQSCLKNNPCLLVILTEWLWDACSEDVILGGEGSGGLSGGGSGGMSGAVLELLVTASPCKKLNKQEKKLFKKLLKIREEKHGQWTSSHLKVLSALVPLVMKQSHISLLSSLLMWLLRDVRDLLCSETKTCGSELCLLEVATSCVSVCCRNKNELVSILDSSEFGDVFNIILKRVLRRHYCDVAYMDLLCGLVAMAYGRESSVIGSDVIPGDMVVKMVWNHSKFLDVMLCNLESEPSTQLVLVKGAVVRLLVSLMEYTECSRSHVPLLLAAYQGTMNSVDRGLLFLMHSYEGQGVEMGEFRPFMFGRHALEHYQSRQKLGWLMWKDPSFDEVLAMFERDKVFHSLSHFPLGKSLEPTNPFVHAEPVDELYSPLERGDDVYDPSFMLPFFGHHLEAGFVVDCPRFIESGCWGYLVASLASSSEDVRLATCHCLSLFKSQLEGARFREKNQIVLLMEVLRNSLSTGDPPTSEVDRDEMETTTLSDAPQSLLSVHAQLFARLAVLFLRPESDLYPILCDFLVYRPNLDLKTLPFANLLFYSSSPQAATERVWILKVLVDGLRTEQDYKLYKKLGITSSVMAFWHSNIVEPEAKSLIVKLLWRMVQLPHSLRDLVKRQGLFAWLHRALIALRETSKQRELLILSCDSWETWITMVTEAAEEKGYIPYPHQMYEMSMILATVAMETPYPGV